MSDGSTYEERRRFNIELIVRCKQSVPALHIIWSYVYFVISMSAIV